MSLEDRFWSKTMVAGDCWLWTGARNQYGYGQFWHDGRVQSAHRVAYEMEVGPIPEGRQLDHLCRVPCCVNPAHLDPVTQRENLLRGNTITARNAAVTHCPHGHEYTDANTHVRRGARECKACWRRRRTA